MTGAEQLSKAILESGDGEQSKPIRMLIAPH